MKIEILKEIFKESIRNSWFFLDVILLIAFLLLFVAMIVQMIVQVLVRKSRVPVLVPNSIRAICARIVFPVRDSAGSLGVLILGLSSIFMFIPQSCVNFPNCSTFPHAMRWFLLIVVFVVLVSCYLLWRRSRIVERNSVDSILPHLSVWWHQRQAILGPVGLSQFILFCVLLRFPIPTGGGQTSVFVSLLTAFGLGFLLNNLFDSFQKSQELWDGRRRDELVKAIRGLKNHTVVFGCGELGRLTVDEVLQAVQMTLNLPRHVDDQGDYSLCTKMLVVDKNQAMASFIAGMTLPLGCIGYIETKKSIRVVEDHEIMECELAERSEEHEIKRRTDRYIIPFLVGDEKDESTHMAARIDRADTVISTTRDVEAEISLANHLGRKRTEQGELELYRRKLIVACAMRRAANLLERKCKELRIANRSIFDFSSFVGEILSQLCALKVGGDFSGCRILIIGSFAGPSLLFHFLNAWLNLSQQIKYNEESPHPIRNVLVLDGRVEGKTHHDTNAHPRWDDVICLSPLPPGARKEWIEFRFDPLSKDADLGPLGLVPLLREPPFRYLKQVMRDWRPTCVLVLERRPGDLLLDLETLIIERNVSLKESRTLGVVAISESPFFQRELLGRFIEGRIIFGAYTPYSSCAHEISMMVKYP